MQIDRARLVHDWMKAAEPTAAKIGCSPSAIVAQAVLESGWGAAAIGNNVFGIRADAEWQGKVRYITTREHLNGRDEIQHNQAFRDYPTLADSFADHFAFLSRNSRYAAAGVFDPANTKSDREYFESLQRAGYATDPNYASVLLSVQALVNQIAGIPIAPRAVLLNGDNGDDVKAVQRALIDKGFSVGPSGADGGFGNDTEAGVRAFQASVGFTGDDLDGIVGPKTRAALGMS